MRLLNVHTLKFSEYFSDFPSYAIASHRWIGTTEATFDDVLDQRNTDKPGYQKVVGFAEYVKIHVPHIEWIWIDTCCIIMASSAEREEAVNSMWKWYQDAEVCLAYLADVPSPDDLESFKRSQWFRRGWTLQELLAPRTVVFISQGWEPIGYKGIDRCKSGSEIQAGPLLTTTLVAITGVPANVLDDAAQSQGFTVEERLRWTARRETSREEDMSYCLLGIFGLSMSVRYGEGALHARKRLLNKIQKSVQESERPSMPLVQSNPEAQAQSPSSALAPISLSSTSNTGLKLHYCIFGGVNVTASFSEAFVTDSTITLDTTKMIPTVPDPWHGMPKTIILLFEINGNMRTLVTCEGFGTYLIHIDQKRPLPGTAELTIPQAPLNTRITLLAVFWGPREIADPEVYAALYTCIDLGLPFTWKNDFFSQDTWSGCGKTGAIFYKDASGVPKVLTGRESQLSTFG